MYVCVRVCVCEGVCLWLSLFSNVFPAFPQLIYVSCVFMLIFCTDIILILNKQGSLEAPPHPLPYQFEFKKMHKYV